MPDSRLNPRLIDALDAVAPLARLFEASGHHLYLVGGVVRDGLLGIERAENDFDATTEARPEQIKKLVAGPADAVWDQGERFGTIGCRIDGRIYEITTHRAESYEPDSRKPVVAFGEHLEEDLSRRDFTINAMAVDIIDRRLIDMFGGESDLRNRILRTPLDPRLSFSDDPLRMLRAARFRAGYELTPVPELTKALVSMTDRLEIVSRERIRVEIEKLLLLPRPWPGLEMMWSTGLMAEVLSELADLDEAALTRTAKKVEAVRASAAHRWAALLGCPDAARRRLRELKAAGALIADTELILRVEAGLDTANPTSDTDVRRLAAMGNGRVVLEDVIDWKRRCGDATDEPTDEIALIDATLRRLRSTEPDLDSPDVGLDGNQIGEVLAIEPGVEIGRAVAWLRELRMTEGALPADELRSRLSQWWSARDEG